VLIYFGLLKLRKSKEKFGQEISWKIEKTALQGKRSLGIYVRPIASHVDDVKIIPEFCVLS
jgi:hypothetical protein